MARLKDRMRVLWHVPPASPAARGFHAEVTGFTIFSLFEDAESLHRACVLPKVASIWEKYGPVRGSTIEADEYVMWLGTVKIDRWPPSDQWLRAIASLLRQVVREGAVVAWIAPYDAGFVWPGIFAPDDDSGEIYAAFADGLGLICNCGLDDTEQYLSGDQESRLKRLIQQKGII